jgi:hypothetical protein
MDGRGYSLLDIAGLSRRLRDRVLLQVDLLFVKDGSPLQPTPGLR